MPIQQLNPGIWQLAIDTGGTFTDCIARSPQGNRMYVKVLSSGRLRGKIVRIENTKELTIEANWLSERSLFEGYTFHLLHNRQEVRIASHFQNKLILQDELEQRPKENTYFEIYANEEAPILAARLVTQTSLQDSLPRMRMRVGSTKGTNALLERKGAKIAFITNNGLQDILRIGTQQRPHIFSLKITRPQPLYEQVYGITARIKHNGDLLHHWVEDDINAIIQKLKKEKIESVAIALLHSYRYPLHEKKLKRALEHANISFISCSEELAPLIKLLPRASTAVVNAYLAPIIHQYIQNIAQQVPKEYLMLMSSAGSLQQSSSFHPKDSLLSGPAGGVVGAVKAARDAGFQKILTLDMGGTSTDVAHYNKQFDYQFETTVGDATVFSPSLHIETVAAGGGSLCQLKNNTLAVGPESAGAQPGPACYGNGGTLTLTDVNVLLGRTDPEYFSVPLHDSAAEAAFEEVYNAVIASDSHASRDSVLEGLVKIANEKMANAIRKISIDKGYDPKEYVLLAFGGAGGQHAAEIAELLRMKTVVVPYEAGLLSASGIGSAALEKFEIQQVLQPLDAVVDKIATIVSNLFTQATAKFENEGYNGQDVQLTQTLLYMRLQGQETTIEISWKEGSNLQKDFKAAYTQLYQHWIANRTIEVESIKIITAIDSPSFQKATPDIPTAYTPDPSHALRSFSGGTWHDTTPVYVWESLNEGAYFNGPALLVSNFSTTVVPVGWQLELNSQKTAILRAISTHKPTQPQSQEPEAIALSLFTNRFTAIAHEMGALLERTAFSVNVKERLDFSCALLDAHGELLVNAPHIPVHLGSLGICTRLVAEHIPLHDGDIAITNHPGFGGSHLPDITLIAPVYFEGKRIGYVANRAHHAEIGGKRPGSMPTDATCLIEEGVVISPTWLYKNGTPQWDTIHQLLTQAPYPTRALKENIADLQAAVASLKAGIQGLQNMAQTYGFEVVASFMQKIKTHSYNVLHEELNRRFAGLQQKATEYLDDGTPLCVEVAYNGQRLQLDFSGSGTTHSGNLNANPAIVNSVIMYVLRLLVNREIPLNEGLMQAIDVLLPPNCILNPNFPKNPSQCPAVVGGNTETSQRLTDTLLSAFGIAACSQGTMNNLLFGNEDFGYYETICGGTGAGEGFHGASAVHQHMTNTRITDAEIMELRYPVLVKKFTIRPNTGGKGRWNGGNGIERVLQFMAPVSLTVLTQHRLEEPYGMHGGACGAVGKQWVVRQNGNIILLQGIDQLELQTGDTLHMLTPGGGGWGSYL